LQREAFLCAVLGPFDSQGFTIKEQVELLPEKSELNQALPDEFAGEDRAFTERVGRRYEMRGLHLVKAGTNRDKVVLWRVLGRTARQNERCLPSSGVPTVSPHQVGVV
jgi:hypothetical protein